MEDRKPGVQLSVEENQKVKVLQEVMEGGRTQRSAGAALGISERWVRTLLKRLRREGAAGMAHRSRGRKAANRLEGSARRKIVELYQEKYEDFNLTHFREMLEEREKMSPPCRESLRRILVEAGAWERTRKVPKHRLRRPRKEYEGEMLQLDASIHGWFGPEGDRMALVGAIDDATGDVPYAEFVPSETREAYFKLMLGVIERKGVPRAVYTDRAGIFMVNKVNDRELLMAQGKLPETQFRRAMKELGIEWIPAYSPQAKGRIERLWGTFQDRLMNELRLEGIKTLEEANRYLQKRFLPRYNRKFRRPATYDDPVYRPAPSRRRLEEILCWKEKRSLASDHTFQVDGEIWQVLPHERLPGLRGRQVEIRRTLRRKVEAWYGEHRLRIRPAPKGPPLASLRRAPGARAPLAAAGSGRAYAKRGTVHW